MREKYLIISKKEIEKVEKKKIIVKLGSKIGDNLEKIVAQKSQQIAYVASL